eukprot:4904830-Pleurochrysis_carterae.AAC.1
MGRCHGTSHYHSNPACIENVVLAMGKCPTSPSRRMETLPFGRMTRPRAAAARRAARSSGSRWRGTRRCRTRAARSTAPEEY